MGHHQSSGAGFGGVEFDQKEDVQSFGGVPHQPLGSAEIAPADCPLLGRITLLVWSGSMHFQTVGFRINYITACMCKLRTVLSR